MLWPKASSAFASKASDQGGEAFFVVGEAGAGAFGVEMDVERIFGDVDAEILGYGLRHLFPVLGLSCGPETPWYPFRPKEKRGALIF